MKIIHATSLSAFNSCAYRYKYSEGFPPIENTFPGDILHTAVRCKDVSFLHNYFVKYFNGDFQQKEILQDLIKKSQEYVGNLREKFDLYQEIKMILPYDEYIISGTLDVFYYNKEKKLRYILDWKTAKSLAFYKNIFYESSQSIIYTKLIMEYLDIDKVEFIYVVFEKTSTARVKEFSKKYTKKEIDDQFNKIMEDFIQAEFYDERLPKHNQLCFFCPLKDHCGKNENKREPQKNYGCESNL